MEKERGKKLRNEKIKKKAEIEIVQLNTRRTTEGLVTFRVEIYLH